MSDPVEQFIAGLDSLAAAPDRRGGLIVYRIDALDGGHAGKSLETAVEIAELVNWPVAPPHWIHLSAAVSFARTNSQASPLAGWLRHSRQINGWARIRTQRRRGWRTSAAWSGRRSDQPDLRRAHRRDRRPAAGPSAP